MKLKRLYTYDVVCPLFLNGHMKFQKVMSKFQMQIFLGEKEGNPINYSKKNSIKIERIKYWRPRSTDSKNI